MAVGKLCLEPLQTLAKARSFEHARHDVIELRSFERLGDEVGCPHLNRPHGALDVAMRGDHDHLRRRLAAPQGFEDFKPVLLRHLHIQQHELGLEVGDGDERRFAINGNFYVVPLGTHAIRNDLTD